MLARALSQSFHCLSGLITSSQSLLPPPPIPHAPTTHPPPHRLATGQQIDAVSFSVDAAMRSSMMPGMVRPPGLVCEYMAGGSVRAALNRRADFLRPAAVRLKLALDTARG